MYILKNYPQMSETYIKTEIEAVAERCDISVLATRKANLPSKKHVPFQFVEDTSAIREAIEEFHPDVLHSHWLNSVKILGKLARKLNIPFTVRAHSFDSIWQENKSAFDFLPFFVRSVYHLESAGPYPLSTTISVSVFSHFPSPGPAWRGRAFAVTRSLIAIRW